MQRKLAEDELRASEERYRLMADNVTDIISRHALDGTYLYASPSCTALLGYTPAELVGRNGSELIHPDDLEPTRAAYAHFSSQISSLVVCYRIRHRDGHYLWLETISKPIYEAASGTVKEILAVSRDITERKRIESELAHSLALQQAIIASSGGGIMVIDHDGAVLSHNREFLHIWGLPDNWLHVTSGDQRLELLARQVLHPERFIARVKELHTRTEAEGYDIIELHDRRLIERYSTPYRVDGHIAGRVWSFRDVTGRQRAAAELRASQNRLQAIFDNTSVGVALLDTRGHYIEMNDRWAQMLRTTPDDIYQTTYLDAVPLDTASEHYAQWQALLQGTAESIQIEQLYHRKDGSKFWGDTSIQAIRGAQQHVEQLVCVVADVTERKRFEEALHYANDQLKVWNGELERHNRDMTTLNDLSELLQRCRTFDEVYAAVEQFIPSLFENTTGALYILQPHTEKVAPVVYWGDEHIWAASITLDTCQALRRGRSVLAETQHDHQRCQHCAPSMHTPTICLPLVAYGEKFGLLTLHNSSLVHVPQARENWQRLAIMVAEHLALTLANLQLREHLQQQAVHDPLTGLFNRRYLKETLESRLHIFEHHRRPVGVIMLDIDHFKQFNDTYGHDGGDTLLRAMGSFLKANTRETDIVCRYGGEEFTLLLPEASPEDTRKRAEQLCEDVRTLCVMHGGKPLGAITISLGVASFPHDGETIEAVVHVADAALLQAKTNGRDQIVMATALSYEAGLGEQLPQSI
jgi:diguanylate cyclase (GGDEF)-like protein/PAS domain S-box-containing protein